ncbi:MAG: OmpA family protein [Bacteroidales bacterium]|nr:OmpA family protein [Bacteroidales bacterium]
MIKYLITIQLAIFAFSINAQVADEYNALLNGLVTDYSEKVKANEEVSFYSHNTKETKRVKTDAQGKFKILLSKGDTYSVKLLSFDQDIVFSDIEVPNQPGLIEFEYQIKYQLPQTYILENVYFDTGKASLKESSFPSLNNLVKVLKQNKNLVIEIGGHTDDVGSYDSNMILSKNRAESVKKYLITKGVVANQIQTNGYGSSQPIDSNETEEGRQKNRRTQVTVLKQ